MGGMRPYVGSCWAEAVEEPCARSRGGGRISLSGISGSANGWQCGGGVAEGVGGGEWVVVDERRHSFLSEGGRREGGGDVYHDL